MLAQRGGGVLDVAVDGEVDQILELVLAEASADEAKLEGRLLAAFAEVAFVEGEAQVAVFEDEVLTGVVVAATCLVHD